MTDTNRHKTDASRPTVCIHTIGCQMNVYDSGRMTALLNACGYQAVSDAQQDRKSTRLNSSHYS